MKGNILIVAIVIGLAGLLFMLQIDTELKQVQAQMDKMNLSFRQVCWMQKSVPFLNENGKRMAEQEISSQKATFESAFFYYVKYMGTTNPWYLSFRPNLPPIPRSLEQRLELECK